MLACVKETTNTTSSNVNNNPICSSHLVYTLILHKLASLGSNTTKKQQICDGGADDGSSGVSSAAAEPSAAGVQLALLQALPALAAERSCVQQLLRLGKSCARI
jgi:hypothetical protein